MSGARKLQTEIDRVMKKIDEGVDLFNEIWEKVYSAEQQNQKEKYEMDLKKEIKKLQRLRDQIKSWISSSEVKDKDALVSARRLIETKMEQFKICEKETKTKTYSKEGLARAEKLNPEDEAKQKTTKWISDVIDQLNQLVDDRDVEIERLSSGKGKKSNKHIIEEYNQYITNHKFHISKLEGIMRLVNNDRLEYSVVDEIKEDLEYYIEAYEEDEYIQSYDEDIFYEPLGLDELDVVNVDRVTQPVSSKGTKSSGSFKGDDDSSERSGSRSSSKASKKSSASSGGVIPLTIGRARVSSNDPKEKTSSNTNTPTKPGRNSSNDSSVSIGSGGRSGYHSQQLSNTLTTLAPAPVTNKGPPPSGGASMAAILKRDGEQQEKEKQKQLQQQQQQQLLREQQARERAQQAELRQQQLRQQQEAQLREQQAQQAELRQQQLRQQQAQQQAQQEALKRQEQQLQEQQRQQQQQQRQKQEQEAAAKQQQLHAAAQQSQQTQQVRPGGQSADLANLLTKELRGLNPENSTDNVSPSNAPSSISDSPSAVSPQQQHAHNVLPPFNDASASYLGPLNDSFLHCPSTVDSERQRTYTPRNPYPTPTSYPSAPSPIFENPAIFEKLGTDCLFFIFYYAQGTYQQYLAARELKKQSWRYHKKYMTWFQRHEEPKVTTDEYEQGTYVYFDFEAGWCQRIKSDFRFEYSYLEDSLII
eukprot:CAMPEP_0195522614 /NCGR_PEP_ID=MMETSP0794_2-20130614/20939_1 /TAXON_ID=515487 /ORGANISM="Stephanopyxis turris, Strain CCMP 815" /LENGTH=700 /DNA_ID=CAMNT_0040652411 /DNA_START=27 /DNA_END=2129 /DNA_ORIENTATION=+